MSEPTTGIANTTTITIRTIMMRQHSASDAQGDGESSRTPHPAASSDDRQSRLHGMKMELLGRLAGGIAHDFNNLLMIVIGLSEGVLEQLGPDDPLRTDVTQILEAGRRGATLASQILSFSRKPMPHPATFDIQEALAAMEPLMIRLLGPAVQLTLTRTPTPAWLRADRDQLEQVVLNLVTNAHDAMPQGGRLTIDTSVVEGTRVRIRLSDTGTGMSDETRARIFEPFFTTKARGKGTGLGLAQVSAIVAEHGGTVHVDSAPDQGTTFTLDLPAAGAPEHETTADNSSAAGGSR